MRKRILKKSQVLREGYIKGLRKAQYIISEMLEGSGDEQQPINKMRNKKTYTIRKSKSTLNGHREYLSKGTLEELIEYHHYTLECGHSYNRKIDMNPKTIKGLVNALNKSAKETDGGWNVTTYTLV